MLLREAYSKRVVGLRSFQPVGLFSLYVTYLLSIFTLYAYTYNMYYVVHVNHKFFTQYLKLSIISFPQYIAFSFLHIIRTMPTQRSPKHDPRPYRCCYHEYLHSNHRTEYPDIVQYQVLYQHQESAGGRMCCMKFTNCAAMMLRASAGIGKYSQTPPR